jgi:hypothetical protein
VVSEEDLESYGKSYVWYAAYGSNLLKRRFMCYLEGTEFRINGTVLDAPPRCTGGTEVQGDSPFNDQPFNLHFKLYFAHEKTKWGRSGVAFVETDPATPSQTLGRAYLLNLQQLECLAKEENGGSHPIVITNDMLSCPTGTAQVITTDQKGWYRVLLMCGLQVHSCTCGHVDGMA